MATAKKLPSGQYRVRAYVGIDENGKKITKSFTAATKKEAEYLASEYLLKHKSEKRSDLTFGEALDRYVEGRASILSPSTIREYRRASRYNLLPLVDFNLDDLTQDVIQRFVNDCCEDGDAPKYVRNIHGIISATLNVYKPDMRLRTKLPPKVKPELYIPSDEEVVKVIKYIRGVHDQELLVAILLAAYGPMRRSEVCALRHEDVNGNTVHTHRAMVDAGKSQWVLKDSPKTSAGDRYIEFPEFVIKEIPKGKGRILSIDPDYITRNFCSALRRAEVPHFRYHDLRHYSASIQHALGVPDAYIMQRGGWESDSTLKQIYRHAMDEETKKTNQKINDYFSGLQE